MIELLLDALKDSLLYACPTSTRIDKNLLTIQVNSEIFTFDYLNGKVEKVWYNGIPVPLSISEKFNITLLLCEQF